MSLASGSYRPIAPTFVTLDAIRRPPLRESPDVDAEIDELMSDDERIRVQGGGGGGGDLLCRWQDCGDGFDRRDELVTHLQKCSSCVSVLAHPQLILELAKNHTFATGPIVRDLARLRPPDTLSSLIVALTLAKGHTLAPSPVRFPFGFIALNAGCGKTFTRSDAMNKHLRTLHGLTSEPPRVKRVDGPSLERAHSSEPTPQPAYSAEEEELLFDEDIAEVLPRLRSRQAFWTLDEDDQAAIARVRAAFPRPSLHASPEHEDGFDEGVSGNLPVRAIEEGTMPNPENPRELLSVVGRSKWQAKYIMGKAKLMLVEEENLLRRRELQELMEMLSA